MDRILVHLIVLDPLEIMGISYLLIILGGVLGARAFEVRMSLRRIAYLWWFAGLNLALVISQFAWSALPIAAEAGMFSAAVIVLMGCFVLYGAGLYYGSAARSNDIEGSTGKAWLGFVPFANLWLMIKGGRRAAGPEAATRSGLVRYVRDPLLVVGALFVLAVVQTAVKLTRDVPAYDPNDSPVLSDLIAEVLTLEQSFAAEAEATRRLLPLRVDEITVLTRVEADGDTLRLTYLVERDITGFRPDFEAILAKQECAPEMFARDLARGGRVVLAYIRRDGSLIRAYEITQEDCPAR